MLASERKGKTFGEAVICDLLAQKTFVQRAKFKKFKKFSDDHVPVSLRASSVIWNKPTPVGATILDLSELSSCELHYEEMLHR